MKALLSNKQMAPPLTGDGPGRPPGTQEGPTPPWGRALRYSRNETRQPNVEDGRKGASMGTNGWTQKVNTHTVALSLSLFCCDPRPL